ncbi:MAG: aminotransferase class I/II-fold pyridoxal phosphate-dependent enzyme [Lachnospiraceae bacterium]|nr:aminotransferase class I/II-fold pyridoxal phosphate-dependent enzyme [Lachnospiraceae bacterium]
MNDIHGGDIYRNRVTCDFSVSVNPLGMPEGSIRAAKQGIMRSGAYPDSLGMELRQALAAKEHVKPEEIVLGNGAAELIYALCYALRPQKAVVTAPSFSEYEAAVTASGGDVLYWDLEEKNDYSLKEEALSFLTEDIDLVFLCNPNNPTGSLTHRSLLLKIAAACEQAGIFFCVDECFLPFLKNEESLTLRQELKSFPHLLILRAFTKIYAMPGLRLGYAMSANRQLLMKLRLSMQPWNTSIPAQMAGLEALKEKDYIRRTRQLLARERAYLCGEMADGLAERIYDSSANYIFFRSRSDLQERLLSDGILIRSCANYRNLSEGFFRIGIRTHEENQKLIESWRKWSSTLRRTETWQNQL